jgi:hypothetical protein
MCSEKNIEAWPQAEACRQDAKYLEGLDQAGLFDP